MMNDAAQLKGSALSFFSLAIWQGFVPNKFTAVPKVHQSGFKVNKTLLLILFVHKPQDFTFFLAT